MRVRTARISNYYGIAPIHTQWRIKNSVLGGGGEHRDFFENFFSMGGLTTFFTYFYPKIYRFFFYFIYLLFLHLNGGGGPCNPRPPLGSDTAFKLGTHTYGPAPVLAEMSYLEVLPKLK